MKTKPTIQRSESLGLAALLALAGGLLDAYTYLCRGGVFANAQTGNMVLLAIRAAEGDWRGAGHYLVPVAAFAAGVLVAEALKERTPATRLLHWRQAVLAVEMAVLAAAACIPLGAGDAAVNVLVSFVCAMQVEAFRKVRGHAFASTMCTGNLRSGTEAFWRGARKQDPAALETARCYFAVIGCFIAGAALGGLLLPHMGRWTVLAAVLLQLGAFLWMCL